MGIKRLPWLRNLRKTDPEPPLRLPIAAGAITNGEGYWPDTKRKQLIRKLVKERAEDISRKHGVDRREFMASSCGMATTFFVINMLNGCAGKKRIVNVAGTGGTSGVAGMGGVVEGLKGHTCGHGAIANNSNMLALGLDLITA